MKRMIAVTLVGFVLMTQPIQTASADVGRFLMERIEQGFVRLDTQTGEVSLCRMRDEQIICRLSADERSAFEDTIAVLEERIERLEQLVAERGAQQRPAETRDDIDKAMQTMEEMMRRFLGVIDEFDRRSSGEKDDSH